MVNFNIVIKHKNMATINSEIQEIINETAIALEQVRKQYAEAGLSMVCYDKKLCKKNEILLVYPDGSTEVTRKKSIQGKEKITF